MSFNFGQHLKLKDNSNYIDDILGNINLSEQSTNYKKIYEIYPTQGMIIIDGSFYISVLVNPVFDKNLTTTIKLIKNDDSYVVLKTADIKQGSDYLSSLVILKEEEITLLEAKQTALNTYNAAVADVETKAQIKADAEQAWALDNYSIDTQSYIDYKNAEEALNAAIRARDWDRMELSKANASYEEVVEEYNTLLGSLYIPVEKSFTTSETQYKKVIVEIESTEEITENINIQVSLYKLKEILNNLISQTLLKRISIQGATKNKFLINNNEIMIGANNVLEITSPRFKITSLKVIPKDFFVIDYEY